VALHHLVQHLRERGFALFDTQVMNPATRQLGAINVAREDYLKRLKEAVALPCVF
jgi:leucyl/phenylalanyl-tRNA--protein transferase